MPHPILHHRTRWTHEKFLIDALLRAQGDAARRMKCLVLHRHRAAFAGCRDPDRRFRDFHNHVIHVDDGFWGGAPRLATKWFHHAVDAFANRSHALGSYAIGVLTHYVTDPMHPLHTGSDSVADLFHGPAEFLANVRYREFRDLWLEGSRHTSVRLGQSPQWLGQAILRGAALAHRLRDPMVAGLDLAKVSGQPAAAHDDDFARANANMIGVAITTLARIVERVAEAAEVRRGGPLAAPTVDDGVALSCSVAMFPAAVWKRRAWQRRWQRRVLEGIEEFRRTGGLHDALPTELDVVRRVVQVNRHERNRVEKRHAVAWPTAPSASNYPDAAVSSRPRSTRQRPSIKMIGDLNDRDASKRDDARLPRQAAA